jgi:hypothetical protein
MQFLVSTVSSDVLVKDLGIFLAHPAVDYDLATDFSADEIANSSDLTTAISDGLLTLKIGSQDYGETAVDGYDYDPYMLLQQNFSVFAIQEQYVTSSELISSNKDVVIYDGVFPVQVSSTTSFTKTIVCNNAKFELWRAYPGDIIVIVGGAAAGTYTIASVDSQTVLTTVESLPSSIGVGVLSIYHPTGASTIGIDPTGLTNVTATDIQGAIEELDSAITSGGITEPYHENIDSLVHNISEDSYENIIYDGNKVASITTYTNVSMTTKIREYQYTYIGNKIYQQVAIQYDAAGVEIQRLTSTYAYNGNIVSSISNVETP